MVRAVSNNQGTRITMTEALKKIAYCAGDFFTPSSRNAAMPFGLSFYFFILWLTLATALLFIPLYYPASPFASLLSTFIPPFQNSEVLSLVNEARQSVNLPLVSENTILDHAAETKARDMLERQYFSHTTPDGEAPWVFLQRAEYSYTAAGENLAIDYTSARDAHTALMNSPSHRANILNPLYTEAGVAVIGGTFHGNQSVVIVQFFGHPNERTSVPIIKTPAPAPVKTPTPTPIPAIEQLPTTNMSIGASGAKVRYVQKLLASDSALYPEGLITGFYGLRTKAAVERFQRAHGLTPNGVLDESTRISLKNVFIETKIGKSTEQKPVVLGDVSAPLYEVARSAKSVPVNIQLQAIAAGAVLLIFLPLFFGIMRKIYVPISIILRSILLMFFFGYITLFGISELSAPSIDTAAASIVLSIQ